MSIIGEMYEEQIWENNRKLKEKMEEYLKFLERSGEGVDFGTFVAYGKAVSKFKEMFENELRR